ncbi:glycosyltransferase family 39 protein [Saccharopolyspora sp. NFXS83]|uniref:glycosyltransferase family 39 protein n=1 Tax=Saccharopolyspora sp. NFXS83 TaxID=2993560 RepID=UPI00224A4B33|nr:glycosyltransferase family 39 protein [Saccharopolyspora sp. NFXS83]MCX2729241.1 glycosyltransferase family 39 protein [Saccharopolyspora sp. NFXS83]
MEISRPAWAPVSVVAGVVATAHLALAAVPRRWFDEDLMLTIGRHHLDWGAVDQPPLTPLLARFADAVAPGNQVVLAFPAVLATAAAIVLVALMARELGGDRRAQVLAASGQATCVAAAQFGHWLTPYTLEPALWAGLFWLLLRWIRVRDDRLLPVFGAVAGIAAQTRFQVLALGIVLLGAVVLVGPRALLRRPLLWAGVVLALLIAAPTLGWQAAHGWPQAGMAQVVAGENELIYGGRTLVVLHGVAVTGPLTLGLAVCGLVALCREARWREHRFLAVAFALLVAAVVLGSGRHYYLIPLWSPYVAIGAVALQHRREAGARRRAWPVVAFSAVLATGALVFTSVMASPRFADELATATARAYADLPAEQRARTALVATPYVYATYLDAAPPELGLPPAASTNRAYGWFPPPPEHQDRVLFVGDLGRLRPWFAEARPVAVVEAPTPLGTYGGLVPERTTIWQLTGRTAAWPVIWEDLRDLTLTPR